MKKQTRQFQSGFTLIEVLVAMVVVALGLLGYAGLQVSTLRSNHTALVRSQATMLEADIVESMRVNRDAALAGSYATTNPSTGTVAGNDLYDWKRRLQAALPGATWSITVTPGASSADPATVAITINWTSNITGAATAFPTRTTI